MSGVQVMVFVVTAVVLPLLLAEFGEWCPWLAERLVRWAARRLGDPADCARYEEEWTANLREVPGKLSRLIFALGLVAAVPKMWWTLRIPAVGLGWLLPWRAYQLARERLRLQTVVAHASDVVMVVGPDATIRYVSPVVERAFGYAPAELLGIRLDDLAHPEDRAALLGYLRTASRQPTADDVVEWRWRDQTGGWRDVMSAGTNLAHLPDIAGVVLNTRDVSERKALERERAQLLDKTVKIAEDERIRIAGDLHIGPIERLTTMGYDLHRAHRWIEKGELNKGMGILETTLQQLSTEIYGLREMMADLRPPVLDEVGLETALREHLKLFANRSGVRCELETSTDDRLDAEREAVLYRVSQEALNNVAKHARATRLRISLRTEYNATTTLEISDNGVGFPASELNRLVQDHFGLELMRQRVNMIGGHLKIDSAHGEGVTITVHFTDDPRESSTA